MVETNWTYIRIRKSTAKKIQILKAQLEAEMYDDVVDVLLSNYTFKNRESSQAPLPSHKQKLVPTHKKEAQK